MQAEPVRPSGTETEPALIVAPVSHARHARVAIACARPAFVTGASMYRYRAAEAERGSLAVPPVAGYDSYSPTAGFGSPVLASDSFKGRTM